MTDMRRIVTENRRMVWIIAAGLIVNAALYVLVVRPLSLRVQTGQEQAGEATRELVNARRLNDSAKGTVTGKKQADEELLKFYRDVLPADFSGARRMLLHVEQLASKSNLTRSNAHINPAPPRKGSMRKLTMTVSLSGEYADIRKFIHELETAPEFLVLESVTVRQGPEGEGERNLNVTAEVATYYRGAGNGN
jgi:Tfp pilus assembly protein PilO